MFLDEHFSKQLFHESGIPVPEGALLTPDAIAIPDTIPAPWFLKAQVLAGGRGKAGGILRADTPEEFFSHAKDIFGMTIKGHTVPFIRVESATDIAKECYLSFVVSRQRRELLFTVSASGGMDVENAADAQKPFVQRVPIDKIIPEVYIRAAFFALNVDSSCWTGFRELVRNLHSAVCNNGLLLAEINPLVLSSDASWVALDGKVELDDNVVDLLPDTLEKYYTPQHHSNEETLARDAGLSYVELQGWVGILVNGAGLAMATMDLLNFSGLPAANFMDLGGAADQKRMRKALDILFENGNVRAIFINLFGGIVSCNEVAKALVAALGDGRAPKRLVVRMAGYESAEGRALLAGIGHPDVFVAEEMQEALDELVRITPDDVNTVDFPRVKESLPARGGQGVLSGKSGGIGLSHDSQILVQGLTGNVAQRHAKLMKEYGSSVVAGVTPFKGGQEVLGIPVYNSVHEACEHHRIDASIIFVPAAFAADAVVEAAAENIPWVVCITEGIPQASMLTALKDVSFSTTRIIGPNTPGIIVPGQCKVGIMPGNVFSAGNVAILSRSGTLTYEAASRLTNAGIGQSFCAGVGGDPFIGSSYTDIFALLRDDDTTQAVLVLGEVGGNAEEELAHYVRETGFPKPVVAFVAGRTAPVGKRLGHAGAILDEASGSMDSKLHAMREAGFAIAPDLVSVPDLVKQVLPH